LIPLRLYFYAVTFLSSFTEEHQTENQQGKVPKLVIFPPAPLTFIPVGKAPSTARHNNNQSSHIHKPQSNTEDPLAEFYEKAKAERNRAVSHNVKQNILTQSSSERSWTDRDRRE